MGVWKDGLVVVRDGCRHANGVAAWDDMLNVFLIPLAAVDQVLFSSNPRSSR